MAKEKSHCQKLGSPILHSMLQELQATWQLSPGTLGHSTTTVGLSIRTQQAHLRESQSLFPPLLPDFKSAVFLAETPS